MLQITKKPSRKMLLLVIGELQTMIGNAQGIYLNDTGRDRADRLLPLLQDAFDLCVSARNFDDPN